MSTYIEALRAVLDDAVAEMEAVLDGSHPATPPPTIAEIASFRARTNLCTGLGAAAVAGHLNLYLMVRRAYYDAIPNGSVGELRATWQKVASAYHEAEYQACIREPVPVAVDIDLEAIVRDAVEAHRASHLESAVGEPHAKPDVVKGAA